MVGKAKSAKVKGKAKRSVGGAKRRQKGKQRWSIYIHKTLRSVHGKLGMSSKAMRVMNSFMDDLFERISLQSVALSRMNKTQTIASKEIQTAVRLVLPGELSRHAMTEGTKAVHTYNEYIKAQNKAK